ncbi:kinesin-like protein KIN-10C isoform X1 [Selaginella moellendorffii]|uniref:kinesin-like protein KIN-10C isoform X1 n=1 Tax=Selaginella moellendorffii TaxID=88036 RepID=UPI000D1C34EC|nr:kinesin-like protein KIN-10C isoform X1 [Selaginella moellendorffii]|eukprot:XP_024520657.1 kinesin-like protein KIN-10C isoform X1 [Selaginella moellendorffii]
MLSPRVRTPGKSLVGTPARVARNAPSSRIRVICRIRPFLSAEEGENSCLGISRDNDTESSSLHIKNEITGRRETYKLDFCYGAEDHISYIFKMEMEPIVPILFRGCNATVFAYGATGSGKTHTMQGVGKDGLIPLTMAAILSIANAVEATINVSYCEIYMDRCYDLLEPKRMEVSVMDDIHGHIQLRGLSQVLVKDIEEFQAVYLKGCSGRKTGQTELNDVSSRSHAILTVSVTTGNLDNIEKMAVGKLNLIDLAGNEDNRRSGNEGVRLAESSRINQSLFALSNVICALNSKETRIPYRDSKLTRILQDSLGGTSCAIMIACLNPGSYQEAIHTLNLAAKSRQIVNKFAEDDPHEKVDMEAKLKAWREERSKNCAKSPARLFSPLQRSTPAGLKGKSSLQKSCKEESEVSRFRTDTGLKFQVFKELPTFQTGAHTEEFEKENVAPTSPFNLGSPKSPPLSAKLRCLGTSMREALSPLPSNQEKSFDLSPIFQCLPDSSSSQTPLEKLNMRSQLVQDTLMKEYIQVLNRGKREELLALKGIGEKRADYILQLRENEKSPIKELQDLHKIGLSAKLACALFNGTITRQICATPK